MESVLGELGLFCTGCGACASVCPKSAIRMGTDDEGFIKARIDRGLCVGCGVCEAACPVINPRYDNDEPQCRAMAATDEERMESSSGAIFPLLAKSVLADGGVVFGAAWGEDFSVETVRADDEEGLAALRGSKYVQGSTGDTFAEARELLLAGRRVLWSGTPCQVAGLNASLGEELAASPNLLTVEVVCHGVPSQSLLRDYLADAYGEGNVESVAFRDKRRIGWMTGEVVETSDGEVHVSDWESQYMAAFNPCLIMGRACGVCPFARLPRQADVSLGDFWGIELFDPSLSDLRGLSVVLANSERGRVALDVLPPGSLTVDREVPLAWATEINKTVIHPFENDPGRKHFYSSRHLMPFTQLTKKALAHHYDVGIVGLWYGINYGSVLTYYALYEVLRSLGKDAVMLPKPNGLWEERFNDPDTIAQRFVSERCNVFLPYPSLGEYPFANDNCDAFVVGSDVVWSYDVCGRSIDQFFFLDWARRDHRRVAYAASVGDGLDNGVGTNVKYMREATDNLRRFDAISAREDAGVAELSERTGRDDIMRVLDPVFLCGADMFSRIADEATDEAPSGCLFSYVLQGQMAGDKRRWGDMLAERMGVERVTVGNACAPNSARALIGEDAVTGMSVEGWIKSVRDASFYFGDSYHGLCFALMFHVPFLIVFPDASPSKPRMTGLLGMLGLSDRLIESVDVTDEEILELAKRPIDWDTVDDILSAEADMSRVWLAEAVSDTSPKETDRVDSLHDEMLDRARLTALESRQRLDAIEEALNGRLDGMATRIADEELRSATEAERLSGDIRGIGEAMDAVLNSRSFRIGRAATWLPRQVRDAVRDDGGDDGSEG